MPGGGFLQGITIRLSETYSITKFDGADRTNFESTKGGISGALKRAAVLFGIGRYLYNLDEVWVNITDRKNTTNDIYVSQKDKRDSTKDIRGFFTPPTLPDWALPDNYKTAKREEKKQSPNNNSAPNSVPPGLFECIFKGMIQKVGNNNRKYYEICFESNEQMCVIYAIGEMVGRIERLQLIEDDRVAISSEQYNGEWVLNNIVKVS